jgi:hypothetical protein
MSDSKEIERNDAPTGPEKTDEVRRRLTQGALAAPVALSTLLSRPALGTVVPYNCTVSGKISNNQSHADSGSCGGLGLSPGCWKQNNTVWPSGISRTSTFYSQFGVVFDGKSTLTLIRVICTQKYGSSGYPSTSPVNGALARAAVANLVNAYFKGAISSHDNYPLTVSEVKNLVKQAFLGNDTISNATGGRVTTLDYLTSLYGGTASSPDGTNTTGCPKNQNQYLTSAQKCG